MAETELTSAPHPIIDDEYIWFDGMPVAQESSTGETRWTFTDHLGTPILQTSSLQGIVWRAEYEPYGRVFELRVQDVHQPLRLPGQEAEQLNAGANGATDRSYNAMRWILPEIDRYNQPDPLGLLGGLDLFRYAAGNPLTNTDPFGLKVCSCTRRLANWFSERNPFPLSSWAHHSFIQVVPDGRPCGGFRGLAWGFERVGWGRGRVEPELTPVINNKLRCEQVPCVDQNHLVQQIIQDMRAGVLPYSTFSACGVGKPWNRRNCQGWVHNILRRSRKKHCCDSGEEGRGWGW